MPNLCVECFPTGLSCGYPTGTSGIAPCVACGRYDGRPGGLVVHNFLGDPRDARTLRQFKSRHAGGEQVCCASCNFPAPLTETDWPPGSVSASHGPRLICEFCSTTMASRHTEYTARTDAGRAIQETWRAAAGLFHMLRGPAEPCPPAPAPRRRVARPLREYHEDMGPVVWWSFPVNEPAWIGRPDDSDWPGYHTHFTPHPATPTAPDQPTTDATP